MADDQDDQNDQDCRFIGPDADGFFWLQRTETNGASGAINLGCCDEEDLLAAMAHFLLEKGWLEAEKEGQFAAPSASGLFGDVTDK